MISKPYSPAGLVIFSAPAASKSSRDGHIALRYFPRRYEKSQPSNCFHLDKKGSSPEIDPGAMRRQAGHFNTPLGML
jgi:hypothetical protein